MLALGLFVAGALTSTAHAQPGCVGLGYACGSRPCCNPFHCGGDAVSCPHGITPCCVPIRGAFDQAMLTNIKNAQEMVKAAEAPFFEALAVADEEKRAKNLAKTEAKASSDKSWMGTLVNALFKKDEATCEHTANACTANSQCCSKNCRCNFVVSKVCCAFPPGEDPEEEGYYIRRGNLRNDLD